MSQWAERYRVLSPEATANHGPWLNTMVPYLPEIMDAVSDRTTQEIVVVSPSQAAKTELILNAIGYFIHQEPSPMLCVQPTVETAESFSKDRVAPMIRDCGALNALVAPARSRESNNTILSKALALDTPIPTPEGWSTIGALRAGDVVFGPDGQPCRVTAKSEVFTDHTCYRVTFSDGAEIVADAGHLWAVEWWQVEKAVGEKAKNVRHQGVLRTEQMAERVRQGNRYRYSVRNAEPLQMADAALPIDPYVLGVWLGDGNSDSTRITSHGGDVDEMMQHVEACGHTVAKRFLRDDTYSFLVDPVFDRCNGSGTMVNSTSGLRSELRSMGLLKKVGVGPTKKHIPSAYLRASKAQRLALLQGLMDTDGTVTPDGRGCNFVTTIPALWESFSELLVGLGIKHKGAVRKCHLTINGGRVQGSDAMQFYFAPPVDMPVFRLARKLARQRTEGEPVTRTLFRRIVSIKTVPSVPVQCITVDNETHLFLAGRSMIPTHNSYAAGQLDMTGANAPSGLAMRPKRVILLDERDRHPRSAGTEGDVKAIARARTRSFQRRRKIVEVSSPTSAEESLIWPSYLEGTQEVYEVPCPDCGHWQTLHFDRLKWQIDAVGKVDPVSVAYECAACEYRMPAREKGALLRAGRWTSTADARVPHKRSFHIHGLVAAFALWEEVAQEFVTANGQKDPAMRAEMLRAFFNTTLGELYRDQTAETVKSTVLARAKRYDSADDLAPITWHVPRDAAILTAGVDLQHDRGEIVVRAWGVGETSWLVERAILRGDTSQPEWWARLEDFRTTRRWTHERGALMAIRSLTIDAGDGTHSKAVYTYCASRLAFHVYAIKGSSNPTAPMVPSKPTKVKPGRLYILGVHAIMDRLYRRLGMDEVGPGYLHLNQHADDDYVTQLLSMRRRIDEKTRKRKWEATPGVRNEVADCETYAYAALLLGPVPVASLAAEVDRVNADGQSRTATKPEPPTPTPPRPTGTWIPRRKGWR
jgi:phage terminase large subunit GpA-like protein